MCGFLNFWMGPRLDSTTLGLAGPRQFLQYTDQPHNRFQNLSVTQVEAIVRGCSQYDLKRQSKEEKSWNQHVTTGKFDKGKLRRIMADKYTDPKFLEARALLGYPKPKAH